MRAVASFRLVSNPVDVNATLLSVVGGCCSCQTNDVGFTYIGGKGVLPPLPGRGGAVYVRYVSRVEAAEKSQWSQPSQLSQLGDVLALSKLCGAAVILQGPRLSKMPLGGVDKSQKNVL